jgi:hypothetical protein
MACAPVRLARIAACRFGSISELPGELSRLTGEFSGFLGMSSKLSKELSLFAGELDGVRPGSTRPKPASAHDGVAQVDESGVRVTQSSICSVER